MATMVTAALAAINQLLVSYRDEFGLGDGSKVANDNRLREFHTRAEWWTFIVDSNDLHLYEMWFRPLNWAFQTFWRAWDCQLLCHSNTENRLSCRMLGVVFVFGESAGIDFPGLIYMFWEITSFHILVTSKVKYPIQSGSYVNSSNSFPSSGKYCIKTLLLFSNWHSTFINNVGHHLPYTSSHTHNGTSPTHSLSYTQTHTPSHVHPFSLQRDIFRFSLLFWLPGIDLIIILPFSHSCSSVPF